VSYSCTANELLTPSQVAAEWGVSLRTVQRYIAAGKLRTIRLPSGHHRIRRQDIEAAIEHPA
jgi:excisionase family DNA binding protein